MHIIYDQAEGAPWRFNVRTEKVNLPTGDYSLPGFEPILCVERKSLPDLVHTVVSDWQRFARQLRRMAAMDTAFIICEAPASALLDHKYTAQTSPLSVRGKLNAIQLDFGVTTMFLDNRTIAAEWTLNLFQQFLERRGLPRMEEIK